MTPVRNDHLWFMFLSTLRYSLGRASYAPSYTADLWGAYGTALEPHHREQAAREIRDHLATHKETPSDGVWLALAASLEGEKR